MDRNGLPEPRRTPLSPLEWGLPLVLAVFALLEGLSHTGASPVRVVVSALILLTLGWRRRRPVLVFCLVAAAALATASPYASLAAILIAAYAVGLYGRRDLLALGLLIGFATLIVRTHDQPVPSIPARDGPYLLLLIAWLAARALRNQRLTAEMFQERASELEANQQRAAQLARVEERGRITRELHDVVAHSVSVMVVQAGAARSVVRQAPDDAAAALLTVEATGREALNELRRLLGVLSEGEPAVDLQPQPGLEQLDALAERVREAGLRVAMSSEGQPVPLSPGLNLTAYRIVQEALTNALKYAPCASVQVTIAYAPDELRLTIRDDGPGDASETGSTGRGLVGMRERVAVYGGRLETGPRLGGGYAVRAWLPLDERA